MSEYTIFMDHNKHTYLQYRDNGKTRNYVSMVDGSIDCIQLSRKDWLGLKKYEKCTPEHFAEIYLKSHLSVSRSARAILRGILGNSEDILPSGEAASFSSGSVPLEEICEVNQWNPQKARKHLRKLVEKPGGRWAWPPEEAEKIVNMLKECFSNE